jgi:hypothetical protein
MSEYDWLKNRIHTREEAYRSGAVKKSDYSDEILKEAKDQLKVIENCLSSKIYLNLLDTLYEARLPYRDFTERPHQFGRAPDGRLVIADAGFTEPVSSTYYEPTSMDYIFREDYEGEREDYEYPSKVDVYYHGRKIPEEKYVSKDPKNIIVKEPEPKTQITTAETHHGFDPDSGERLRPSFENGDLVMTSLGRIAKYLAPATWKKDPNYCILQFMDREIGKYEYHNESDLKLLRKALPEKSRILPDPFSRTKRQPDIDI